jgi:F-type H+-transporting ATPase subunit gamma
LHILLESDKRVTARIEGASVAEEVTAVLNPLVDELLKLQETHGLVSVRCLYHGSDDDIVIKELLPPFEHLQHAPPRFAHAPVLHQPPGDLLLELTGHYLFAALHQVLYTSLMAENHHRIAHLDGAVKHLDNESAELTRRCNALRQEEIVEEIEVILLSAASLGDEADRRDH